MSFFIRRFEPEDRNVRPDPELMGLIDDYLSGKTKNISFNKRLEALYESATGMLQQRRIFFGGIVSIIIYNSFFLLDPVMVPDLVSFLFTLRLYIVNPVALAIILLMLFKIPPYFREALIVLATFVVVSALSIPLILSQHPNVLFCHATVLLGVIFGNLVLRPQYYLAVVASVVILVTYIAILPYCAHVPTDVRRFLTGTVSAAILFSLFANYTMEKEYRRGYLLSLRERMRQSGLIEENVVLSNLASHDPLTGLSNRREFDLYLKENFSKNIPLSLIMIDVDYFKKFNDLYGHLKGDECLRQIASILKTTIRGRSDIAARYGGEEFAVILPGDTAEDAVRAAERIRISVLEHKIPHENSPVAPVVTISAGISSSQWVSSPEELIGMADNALYRSKSQGRNQICISEPGKPPK